MISAIPNSSLSQPDQLPSSKLIPFPHRRSILLFCAANFLFWAGLYLYVPILPVYIQSLDTSLYMVGLVIAAYAIPQVLLRIPIGIVADNLQRRKPLVVAGMIFALLGALWLWFSGNLWLLFLARMVTGIGAATWVIFPIYFIAYYPLKESGRAIGLINFVQNAALVAATASGGALAQMFGPRQTFFGAAIIGVLGLGVLFFTKEPSRDQMKVRRWQDFSSVATCPLLITISVMGILLHFVTFAGVFSFLPIYANEIGASSADIGLITMLNMGLSTLGALCAIWLWEKFGIRVTIISGSLLIGISLFAIPFIQDIPLLMAVQISYGLGRGVLMTMFMALSIRNVRHEHQATAMGIYQAVYAIGMLLGPLTSGFLSDRLGLSNAFYLSALISLLISALVFIPVLPKR